MIPMLTTSVSNIDLYRTWRSEEELDLAWLVNRILGPREQTPAMGAGEAFHKAIEDLNAPEVDVITSGKYRFEFNCDCELELTKVRELRVQKMYGDLQVRGRVDSVIGNMIVDYKTTAQFDPDRLMTGYQWRFYLDMLQAEKFRWNVFVFRETDDPLTYVIADVHTLEQTRYPAIHDDCLNLARDYAEFAKVHLVKNPEDSLYITEKDAVEA